jgi:hypothetical protein
MIRVRFALAVIIAVLAGLPLAASAQSGNNYQPALTCNNAGFLAVQHAHANRREVTLCGTVARVRPPKRTRSGLHRYIFIEVPGGDQIEIDANLDVMGNFPVHVGEPAEVRGEYYYDQNGREGVHWTHRTDRGTHPAGYMTLDGTTYQ